MTRSKSPKQTIKSLCQRLGTLVRAVNAVENCLTETNRKENIKDTNILRTMVFEQANIVMRFVMRRSRNVWVDEYKTLKAINKTIADAGWDDDTFSFNRNMKDPNPLKWTP